MYKPANIREFVTPAVHKKPTIENINGHSQKTYTEVGTIKGKFKQKSTSEMNVNGLKLINDKISFVTWYTPTLDAQDILNINGIDYEIVGTVENVEMRNRYAVCNLERLKGGV